MEKIQNEREVIIGLTFLVGIQRKVDCAAVKNPFIDFDKVCSDILPEEDIMSFIVNLMGLWDKDICWDNIWDTLYNPSLGTAECVEELMGKLLSYA